MIYSLILILKVRLRFLIGRLLMHSSKYFTDFAVEYIELFGKQLASPSEQQTNNSLQSDRK
jgi:hypothetical protein